MLTYEIKDQCLYLTGDLNYQTLEDLWNTPFDFKNIQLVNLARLTKLDSAGLALLVNWVVCYQIKVQEIDEKMKMLIELYNLKEILASD